MGWEIKSSKVIKMLLEVLLDLEEKAQPPITEVQEGLVPSKTTIDCLDASVLKY